MLAVDKVECFAIRKAAGAEALQVRDQ